MFPVIFFVCYGRCFEPNISHLFHERENISYAQIWFQPSATAMPKMFPLIWIKYMYFFLPILVEGLT